MALLMKIDLCGDKGEGKTKIKEKYMGRRLEQVSNVMGTDVFLKDDIIEGKALKFQIWDANGKPRIEAIRTNYYLGARGAILIFDVTKRESFENLENWIKKVWNRNGKGIIPLVILSYNIEMRDQYPQAVQDKEVLRYCKKLTEQTKQLGFEVKYYQTSTETGVNIKEAFEYLGKIYLFLLSQR